MPERIDGPQPTEIQLLLDFTDRSLVLPRHQFGRRLQAYRFQQFLLAYEEARRPHRAIGPHPRRHLPEPLGICTPSYVGSSASKIGPENALIRRSSLFAVVQQLVFEPLPEVLPLVEPRVLRLQLVNWNVSSFAV